MDIAVAIAFVVFVVLPAAVIGVLFVWAAWTSCSRRTVGGGPPALLATLGGGRLLDRELPSADRADALLPVSGRKPVQQRLSKWAFREPRRSSPRGSSSA
jgi:hypothetical protein